MTKKIFRSIMIVAMTVLMASMVIATSFLHQYFNKTQEKQLKEELALVATTVENAGSDCLVNFDSAIFRFTLVETDGRVLYDTEANVTELGNHLNRKEIKEAFENGWGSSTRYSATLTEKTIYEATLLSDGRVLRISISQVTIGALLLGMLPGIAAIILIAFIVSLLLSGRMAKSVTEPLNELDLEHPISNHTYEELAPVLQKINRQHKQIERQMSELRRKADEFEQITSAMSEGLILLDERGIVISMNEAAKKIFETDDSQIGCDFLTIERSPEMSRAIKEAFSGTHCEFLAGKQGKEYQFDISPIKSDSQILGAVILGFDITERALAEQRRKEFTANVSHELKTPLQTIIGSAELLGNGLVKPEDTNRFVGNIKNEATRMVTLIDDIIRLSQLDEGAVENGEMVDVREVAKEVAHHLSDAAAKKDIVLNIQGESCTVYGIRRYIYEIIYNLCDNAIRYNVEEGQVIIDLHKENHRTIIAVADTGIGIAPEHQERVFERFYRVDKSHSKDTGGTGLGLSIVKHAVQYHGGKVNLESEMGKGTTISVIL